MDKRVYILMNEITSELKNILNDNLVGIYLHGSVAFGCFNWDSSDIDFLVVTKEEPVFRDKQQIIKFLMKISCASPAKGVETSFVLERHCSSFVYPTPYQLHFSNSHIDKYNADINGHITKMQGYDKDLAAHFTVVNKTGITFYGKDKNLVFSPVPKEYYIDSIKFDIENAVGEIKENPVYLSLNLCRVLAYITDDAILSKAEGGLWGMENIPLYKSIIEKAYKQYTEGKKPDFENEKLIEFAEYMIGKIYK